MTADRWNEIEEIFDRAAQFTGDERARYLEEHCTDPVLRAEVEELLRYEAGSTNALHELITGIAQDYERGETQGHEGRRFGAWDVLRELGRGGMGTVYLAARCDDEFQHQVAIKIVNRETNGDVALAQFRAERQLLANLSHPNISRLFDGGTTPEGLPYFVMEYLEGVPITEYCTAKNLPLEDRLRLFLPVCAAVHYAHQKLVIHRDIKPGNLLVTADGTPKLLDFGIATSAATVGRDREHGPHQYGVGITPDYASPEQIRGEDVTTAADVYSLGAVMRRTLAIEGRALPRDLACILAKATAFRPEERYDSAKELALDMERLLAGRAVQAHPQSAGYRISRFVGRHRLAVAIGIVLAGVGLIGVGLYVRQARLAQKRFQDLHRLANSFLFEMDDRVRALSGSTGARAAMVQKALEYLNGLAAEKSGDRQLLREVAEAWRRVGDVQGYPGKSNIGDSAGARRSYEKSIAILEPLARGETGTHSSSDARSSLAESYVCLADLERVAGNTVRALDLLGKAAPIAELPGSPADLELQASRGQVHAIYSWALEARGRTPEAKEHAALAVRIFEPLAAANPKYRVGLVDGLSALGGREWLMGDAAAALAHYRRGVAIREQIAADNPGDRTALRDLMITTSHIGDLLVDPKTPLYDVKGSLAAYRQTLAIAQSLAARDPSDRNARMDASLATDRLGDALAASGNTRMAIAKYTEALAINREISAADPGNRRGKEYEETIRLHLAAVYMKAADLPGAQRELKQIVASAKALLRGSPGTSIVEIDLIDALMALADCDVRMGEREAAIAAALEAAAVAEGIASKSATERRRARLPESYECAAKVYERIGDGEAARAWYGKSLDAWLAMGKLSTAYADRPDRLRAKLR